MAPDGDDDVAALAARADQVRDHLARGIEALDHRRRELVDLGHRLRGRLELVASVGGLVLVGGTLLFVGHAVATRARAHRERWIPAREPPARSWSAGLLGAIVRTAATTIAAVVVRRLVERAITAPTRQPPQLLGPASAARSLENGAIDARVRA